MIAAILFMRAPKAGAMPPRMRDAFGEGPVYIVGCPVDTLSTPTHLAPGRASPSAGSPGPIITRQGSCIMQFEPLALPEIVLITPKRFGDHRGYFSETFRTDLFHAHVGKYDFVQDNQSLSAEVGTIRGLHFQLDPRAQGKLVRCIAGSILDVAVDIRKGSPTYGKSVSAELSAENGCQLWIPPGFAHGFCTLEPDCLVSYKVTDYYSPAHDRGLLWNDPEIGISWPVGPDKAMLSAKDQVQPRLAELETNFVYSPS